MKPARLTAVGRVVKKKTKNLTTWLIRWLLEAQALEYDQIYVRVTNKLQFQTFVTSS